MLLKADRRILGLYESFIMSSMCVDMPVLFNEGLQVRKEPESSVSLSHVHITTFSTGPCCNSLMHFASKGTL